MNKLISLIIRLQDEASAGIEKMNGSLGRMAEIAGGTLLAGAIEAAGQAVVGLGASTLSSAADFESATARFASVAGGALGEAGFALDDVKNKALELGAVTQFSAAEAQDAMINLAKGGVPVADIMGQATQATLDLAAAGELELAQAADIVSKQLGVWGDTGVQAAQVSNLLAQAANASTVDVDELAVGLANVGGVAKVSGVSFEDLTQTMAMIAPGFSSASDAGTSLKTFLLSLQPTTTAAKDAMSQLGLMTFDTGKALSALGLTAGRSTEETMAKIKFALQDMATAQSGAAVGTEKWNKTFQELYSQFEVSKFYDASGAFVGMDQAAALLQGSLSGLSEAEQSAALKAIFGTDAYRAAALIAQNGSAGFRAMGDAMDKAGTAAEQAAIRNQTFKFAWDSLKGSIETVQIIIGSALLPVLTDLTNNVLIPAVNGVMELAQALIASNDPWATFVATLNSVLPGLGSLVDFLGNQIQPILAAVAAAILTLIVPAFWTWATAAWATATATLTAMAPLLLMAGAIALAVGVLVAAWTNNWFGIQEATAAVWAWLQPILAELWAWLGVQLVAAGQALAAFWSGTLWPALQAVGAFIMGTVVPAFVQIWTWLATNIPAAIATVVGAFWSIVATVQGVIAGVQAGWQTLVTTTTTTWQNLVATVSGVVAAVVGVVQAAWGWLVGVTTAAWAAVVADVTTFVAQVGAVVQTGLYIVTTIAAAVWNTFVFATQLAWQAVMTVIQPVLDWLGANVLPPIQAVLQMVVDSFNWWVGILTTVFNTVVGVIQIAWASVTSTIATGAAVISGVASAAWSGISGVASSAWAGVSSVVSSAWSGITGVVSSGAASAASASDSAWASVSATASSAWAGITSVVSAGWAEITGAISSGVAAVVDVVAAGWQPLASSVSAAWAEVQSIIAGVWAAVTGAVTAGVEAVKAIVAGAWAVVVAAAQNDFGSIPGIVAGVWDKVKGAISAGVAAIQGVTAGLAAAAVTLGKGIIDGVVRGLGDAATKVTDKLKSLAKSALDTAKGVLGIKSPSTVFATQVGIPIIDGIVAGLEQASPKAVTAVLELGAKLVDVVSKGVDAFGKLRNLGDIPNSAIASFSASLNVALRSFADMASTWDKAGISWASQFQAKAVQVVDTMAKGVDFLAKLRELGPIPADAADRLAAGIDQTMRAIVAISNRQTLIALAGAQAFAKVAGEILAIIKNGVDAISALQNLTDPPAGSIQRFAQLAGYLVLRFGQIGTTFQGPVLGAAESFAEGAGKILGILKTGVDGLTALNTMSDPVPGVFQKFSQNLGFLVMRMGQVASQFQGGALASATLFTESAGKILGIIKTGVDGFNALSNLGEVPFSAFERFAGLIDQVVSQIWLAADDVGQDAAKAAATFAESAGKVLALLKTGVEGLNLLSSFVAPAWDSMASFRASLMQWVGAMVQLAGWFEGVSLDAAVLFADGASKLLGILKAGVDGLSALSGFVAPAWDSMASFRASLMQWVGAMVQLAGWFEGVSLDAAVVFAEAAGKAVGVLKTGVDGFAALSDLKPVAEGSIQIFVGMVNVLMTDLGAAASGFSIDAMAAAGKFAEAASKSVGILEKGVEGFYKVDTFSGVSADAIGRFADGVKLTVDAMLQLSTMFTVEALAAAKEFATVAEACTEFLKKGAGGFDRLGEMEVKPGTGLNDFAVGIKQLVATMIALSQALSTEALTEAQRLAVSLDNILTVVVGSIKAFKDLAEQVGTGDLGKVTGGLAPAAHNLIVGMRAIVIEDAGDLGAQVLPSVMQGVASTLPAVQGAVQNIGLNLALGLARGITVGTPAIVDAVLIAVNAALQAARTALGIASPSKVLDAIGQLGGAGLARGFETSAPMVAAAAGSMAAASITPVADLAATPIAPRGGGGGGSTNSTSVSITFAPGAIVQQPGENGDLLAKRVIKAIEEKYRLRG